MVHYLKKTIQKKTKKHYFSGNVHSLMLFLAKNTVCLQIVNKSEENLRRLISFYIFVKRWNGSLFKDDQLVFLHSKELVLPESKCAKKRKWIGWGGRRQYLDIDGTMRKTYLKKSRVGCLVCSLVITYLKVGVGKYLFLLENLS